MVTSTPVTIDVVADPVVNVTALDQSICEGGAVTLDAAVSGGSGTASYQWQTNSSGPWEDISGATNQQYTTVLLNAGTFSYRVVVTQDAGCAVTSAQIDITVVADPVVNISVDDNTICEGGQSLLSSTVTGGAGTNSYQWQFNNSGTWQDVAGETGATYLVTLSNPGTFEFRLEVTQDAGCSATSSPISITVVADPVVSIAADDIEVCASGTAQLSATVTGGTGTTTYQWQIDNSGTWDDIPGATSANYNSAPLGVGSYTYRVVIGQDSGCDVISSPVTVDVVPAPVVSVSANDQDICDGGSVLLTADVTGGTGTTLYQWQFNDPIDGWEDIPGEVASTYNTSALPIGSYQYRVNISQDDGCDVTSATITINVTADPVATISASDTEICVGGVVTLSSVVTGGTGTTTYQWQFEDPVDGWEDIPGATLDQFTTNSLSIGTYNYRVHIIQDAGCEVYSDPLLISVVADPTVTVSADDLEICADGSVQLDATVNGGSGTTLYQWQYDDPVDGWENIPGATNATYNTPALSVGSHTYRVEVTQAAGCSVISTDVTVTVVADPTVAASVTDTEICEGGVIGFDAVVSGGTGTTQYQWQLFNGGSWQDISGATSSTYNTALLNAGVYDYRVMITQDAGCSVASDPITVTVVVGPTVSASADDTEVCAGGLVQFTSSVNGGTGTTTYQWQLFNGSTWQDVSGATSSTYAISLLNPGTYQYRVEITQDAGCSAISNAVVVTVVADPVVSISANDVDICAGGNVLFTSSVTGGTGTTSYQWQFDNSGTWQNIGGANSNTYNVDLVSPGTYSYRLSVTQDAGCNTISNEITITVVADPTVSVAVDDTDICDGGSATLTATVAGGAGTTNYQWQEETSPGVWNNISGATAAIFNTPALAPGTYNYQVVVTQDAGCEVTSSPVTVVVVPDPVVSVSADDQTICEGGTVTISSTVTGGTGTTNYQWQINNSPGGWEDIPGATLADYTTPALAEGTYEYQLVVTQDNGCSTTSSSITVTVVEDPTVSVVGQRSEYL